MEIAVLAVLLFVWILCFCLFRRKYSKKYLLSKYKKGSIVYNIVSYVLKKHLLSNNGIKFDNEQQNDIYKKFIHSELGNVAINLTYGLKYEE